MAKDPADDEPKSRADQLREAVEQAFGATAFGTAPVRERAQELADELVGAAGRIRDALDELRPPSPDVIAALREQVADLEQRVAALEARADKPARKPAAKRKPPAA
jgi:polyhydroxyalkanoate synthesis regulator phasin